MAERSAGSDALRIGLVAPPWVAVPPPEYGGTELVIDHLARGLASLGHDVVLFTTGDATCPVRCKSVVPRAVGTTGSVVDELLHVEAAYAELADRDVIHDHTLLGPLWAVANQPPMPVVTTVHGEFTCELKELYRTVSSTVTIVAISHHQRSTAPSVPVDRVIHHGFDTHRVTPGDGDGGYLLFLGRMHPNKGVHRAIRVARASGKRLMIAAKMWEPVERRYYAEQVEPYLGSDVQYLGMVGGTAKYRLLAGAEALLNPIRWPEPFGLVMIEALAAGTPVLTFAEGAAPEVVEHGRTGFICTDEADMVAHVDRIGAIDRRACRTAAIRRFSTCRMVDDHVRLYRDLLTGQVGGNPGTRLELPPGALQPA